jgi:hypothetical protein
MRAAAVALLLGFSSVAFAQPEEPLPPPQPQPVPPPKPEPKPTKLYAGELPPIREPAKRPFVVQSVLPSVWPTSSGLSFETRLDVVDLDGVDNTVMNAFLHAQYLNGQGIGGYVRVPYGYVEPKDAMFEGDGTLLGGHGIGNVELGGLMMTHTSPLNDVLLRGGLAIDTTLGEADSSIVLSTVMPRLIDAFTTGQQTTWGRGQIQFRKTSANSNLRFGGVLGADVPVAGLVAGRPGFNALFNGLISVGLQQKNIGFGFSFVMVEVISAHMDNDNIKGVVLDIDYLGGDTTRLFFQLGFSLENNTDGQSIGVGARVCVP